MNKEVENELKKSRVGFVHFVDISKLTNKQNRGLPCAILRTFRVAGLTYIVVY